jgi:putative sigma-54 modulation protein
MDLQITSKTIELSPRLNQLIKRKVNKLNRHLPNIIETRVEITEERTKSPLERYLVRLIVNSGVSGTVFHSEERGEDPVKALDKAVATMTRQLENHKGKLYEKGRGSSLTRGSAQEPTERERKVVKTKRFDVKPMSLDRAIERMEELGHSFFLFFDTDEEKVKLIYRRKDGNYGLIDPNIG